MAQAITNAAASSWRSRLIVCRRHRTNATVRTATTAATIWPTDTARNVRERPGGASGRTQLGDDCAVQIQPRALGLGAVGEQREAGGA